MHDTMHANRTVKFRVYLIIIRDQMAMFHRLSDVKFITVFSVKAVPIV
jgi:hypothetical protein